MAQQFGQVVSLSSDLSTIAFGFRPTYIRIDATTLNTAFISMSTAVASTGSTAGSFQLTSGAPPLVIANTIANGMSSRFTAIASTGSTAVVRVLGLRI